MSSSCFLTRRAHGCCLIKKKDGKEKSSNRPARIAAAPPGRYIPGKAGLAVFDYYSLVSATGLGCVCVCSALHSTTHSEASGRTYTKFATSHTTLTTVSNRSQAELALAEIRALTRPSNPSAFLPAERPKTRPGQAKARYLALPVLSAHLPSHQSKARKECEVWCISPHHH